jgi:hypothetical protein
MRCNRLVAFVSPAIGLLAAANASAQAPIVQADLRIDARPQVVADRKAEELSAAAAAYQRHEYALQSDGNLLGKVQTIDDAGTAVPSRVRLYFVRRGTVVTHALPDEQGSFQAAGLTPGYYSVVAAGQGGFAAVAVRILPPPERPEPTKANTIGRTKTASFENTAQPVISIPLSVSAIQPIDVRPAFYLAQRYVPQMNPVATPYSPASRPSALPSGDRTASARKGSVNAQAVSADTLAVAALNEATLEAYEKSQFPLNIDGRLSGQLRMVDDASGPADVRLFFLHAGRVVGQADVQPNGSFVTSPLQPGYYSVVAAGPSGFAARGIRVVAATQRLPEPKANTISNTRNASAMQFENIPLNMSPAPITDVSQIQQIAQQDNPGGVGDAPPPAGAPPFAGGAPAGGGGGGGGGGLGGLGGAVAGAALAGGIAGGISAASDNGDGTNTTTTTSNSPTTP